MRLVVRPSRYLHYNAGAFVSAGEACLVDPGITADEVAALVDEVGDAEIRYVVLTHADWDHVLGPEHLPLTTIVAHDEYVACLDPAGVRAMLARLEQHAAVERTRDFEPPLPDVTFADTSTLQVGDVELTLEHAPGHTADMLTIHEPESATLWAADVLSNVEIPLVSHDLGAYEQTLARIAELELATLVPGHGTPTHESVEIRRRLDEDRRYLAELRNVVAQSVARRRSLDETVAAAERISLGRSEEGSTHHRLNVEKAYADLGGDAVPSEVGYERAWKEMTGR